VLALLLRAFVHLLLSSGLPDPISGFAINVPNARLHDKSSKQSICIQIYSQWWLEIWLPSDDFSAVKKGSYRCYATRSVIKQTSRCAICDSKKDSASNPFAKRHATIYSQF
jgi:hypothetical protein